MKKKKKENYNNIIDLYDELIYEYYNNVKTKFNKNTLSTKCNVSLKLVNELIKHLYKKGYISYSSVFSNDFTLTYEGLLYLESIVQDKKARNRDLIVMFFSMIAIIISIAPLLLENIYYGIGLLILIYSAFKWAFNNIGGIK